MAPTPSRPGRLLGQPFRASDAIRDGLLSKAQLQGAGWRRLFRDVYVSAHANDDHLLRVKGAALLLPAGAVISGRSAALLWGATMGDIDTPVEVRAPTRFGPVAGLAIVTGRLHPGDVTSRWRIPVCTVAHAAWELARALPQLDAVAWIDALGHARHTSAHKLIAHAHAHRGEPGSIRAGITLHLCDPRAESPPESHVRVHLHWAGFPSLVPQYQVIVDGVFLARVDLAWPALKIAIEYDGQWHGDGDQLTADRRRYRDLNRAGWFVYPITRADMRDVAALLVDIARVFNARAGALDRSRVRAGWTPGRSAAT